MTLIQTLPRTPRTRFTLVAVISRDGFIGGEDGPPPATWASLEEQTLFLARVAAADWSFMGRGTHEEAYREDRHRVIFSSRYPQPTWVTPQHLWLDPERIPMQWVLKELAEHHPVQDCLILGGTRVHDWFWQQQLIDQVELTIEPIEFGRGLPLLSHMARDPIEDFLAQGYTLQPERILNAAGTRFWTLER